MLFFFPLTKTVRQMVFSCGVEHLAVVACAAGLGTAMKRKVRARGEEEGFVLRRMAQLSVGHAKRRGLKQEICPFSLQVVTKGASYSTGKVLANADKGVFPLKSGPQHLGCSIELGLGFASP